MSFRLPISDLETHEVFNQPPGMDHLALWDDDPLLRSAVAADPTAVRELADDLGSPAVQHEARSAQRNAPGLINFDNAGRRVDEVDFHPGYHSVLARGLRAGYASRPWTDPEHGYVTHAAMVYLFSQVEPGVACPMTMTFAARPALAVDPELEQRWAPLLTTPDYDPRSVPLSDKRAATMGMAMTEKQGGSDVRANTTRATPDGDAWSLRGHKWFCSAPMSDGFLTLAQTDAGLSCFVVPRWKPDGTRNPIHLMRLKDKLGNRANASAEIEYHETYAELLGDDGDGVRTILPMVHHTRLDTSIAPCGLMRRALSEVDHWITHRSTFGTKLSDAPLMKAVRADLGLDWIGATTMAFRVARAFADPDEAPLSRLAVAVAKYWNNKRCPAFTYEAMECLGGVGYIEDGIMPTLYREAPLNSIWEGSGNVICLDILRTMARASDSAGAFAAELTDARGVDGRYDSYVESLLADLRSPSEAGARVLVERMALAFQAALLLEAGDDAVADAFITARIESPSHVYGALPSGVDVDAVIAAS